MKRAGLIITALGFFLFAQVAQADWTPAKRLSLTSGFSAYPAIGVDSSGSLHVVWNEEMSGSSEIFHKKSSDGGATWTTSIRMTWTSGASQVPAIAVGSSGNLYVVWQDDTPGNAEVYYKKSTDGGATWTSGKRLSFTPADSRDPAIAFDSSGNLHLVWWEDTRANSEIYYRKSTDEGATWTSGKKISLTGGASYAPAIAVDLSDNLHAVWTDTTDCIYELYYAKSTVGGATWTESKRITWSVGPSQFPAIVVDAFGNLNMGLQNYDAGNHEVYFKKSTDEGATWKANKRLTWNGGVSQSAAIAVDSPGNLHMVWDDDTPGNPEIYYRKSTDGGATWTPSKWLSWASSDSYNPAIVSDSFGNLHVVWWAYIPGNVEVFYRRFIKE